MRTIATALLALTGLTLGGASASAQVASAPLGADEEELQLCSRMTRTSWGELDQRDQDVLVRELGQAQAGGKVIMQADSVAHALEQGCDVFVQAEMMANDASAELVSPYSRRALDRFEAHGAFTKPIKLFRRVIAQAVEALAPGADIRAKIVSERAEHRRRQVERSAAGSSGMSPEQVREIVQSAVQGAVQATVIPRGSEAPRSYSSDVDKPRYKSAPDAKKFAVVIGIEKYIDLPEARFAERDAEAVREHLRALGYPDRNIMLLAGERASRAQMEKALETWLPQNAGAGSEVFVYYSGHGAPDPQGGQAYLLPRDGDPQYLEQTAYPVARLRKTLSALKSARVVLALDACFSGAGGRSVLPKGTRPLVTKVQLGLSGAGNVAVLTASRADEISGASEEQGHGLFTYYLLRGLNGAAKDGDGRISLKSLHEYLVPNVQDEARRQNRQQNPQLLAEGGGWPLR